MERLKFLFYFLSTVISVAVNAVTITEIPGSIGVEICGMDLSQGITPEEVALIRQLAYDRLVVVIKDQNLDAEQQVLITKQFGDIEIAWDKQNRHPKDCHVHVITNDGAKKNPNYISSTYFWHWDKSFIKYPTSLSFAFFPSDPQPT